MNKTPREQRGQARVKTPQRSQVEMQFLSLDQWLDKDHRARIVWQYAESIDLSELYDRVKATSSNVGRDAIDPRILFALWLLATIEGFTSARRLADLTTRDIPYMWICGGVSVNYHRLSDFRVDHGDLLEQIMIDSIGVLLHQELVTLETVAQDGMRVRASAGASSFRRDKTLTECLTEAKEHLKELTDQNAKDPSGDERRATAAARRQTILFGLNNGGTQVHGVIQNEQKQLDEGKDPYAAKKGDAPEMAAFRARMGTIEGKQKYSQRAGIAEFSNAESRNRGLNQFRVRGRVKAKAQTLWHALAHNFNRFCHLEFLEVVMAPYRIASIKAAAFDASRK